jgi:sec1 family domain-containing protein 1
VCVHLSSLCLSVYLSISLSPTPFVHKSTHQLLSSVVLCSVRAHLKSRNNIFVENRQHGSVRQFQKTVMILLDRDIDLTVPLHHPWTYQAMMHDVLGMRANRVNVSSKDSVTGSNKSHTYDLDSSDDFWADSAGVPFPKVAENVEALVADYKSAMEEMKIDSGIDYTATDTLQNAISSLPEMQKKKRLVDTHTNIATALLRQLQKRELDAYFSLEEDCFSRAKIDKTALMERLGLGSKGSRADKLRLFLIYYLTHDVDQSELDTMIELLKQPIDATTDISGSGSGSGSGGDTTDDCSLNDVIAAIDYCRHFKFLNRAVPDAKQSAPAAPAGQQASAYSLFQSLANKVVDKGAGLLADVQNLMPAKEVALPITNIVSALMENRPAPEVKNYGFADIKTNQSKVQHGDTPFANAFVFVVGGGNFVEYENLKEYAKRTSSPMLKKSIIYGSTELLAPSEFLQQFAALGRKQSQSASASAAGPGAGLDLT